MQNRDENVVFGDRRVETSNFPRYKGTKNQIDRIAFIDNTIKRVYTHYHGPTGTFFRCLSTEDEMGVCCEHMKMPDQRFAAVIFHYTCTGDGNLADESKLQGSVKIWTFSETKFSDLSGFNRKWPLLDGGYDAEQIDLEINCTEDQFQKMTFTPCREAHWKRKEEWYKKLAGTVAVAHKRMEKMLGAQKTPNEILMMLNVKSSDDEFQPGAGGVDLDMSDLLPSDE